VPLGLMGPVDLLAAGGGGRHERRQRMPCFPRKPPAQPCKAHVALSYAYPWFLGQEGEDHDA